MATDKSVNETITALRDYCRAFINDEPYDIPEVARYAATLISDQQLELITAKTKITELESKLSALQAHNNEIMELLADAVADIRACVCSEQKSESECEYGDLYNHCVGCHFKWQHANRYELLKAQFSETT